METKIQLETDGRTEAYVFELEEVEKFISELELLIDRFNTKGFNINNNLLEFFGNIREEKC